VSSSFKAILLSCIKEYKSLFVHFNCFGFVHFIFVQFLCSAFFSSLVKIVYNRYSGILRSVVRMLSEQKMLLDRAVLTSCCKRRLSVTLGRSRGLSEGMRCSE